MRVALPASGPAQVPVRTVGPFIDRLPSTAVLPLSAPHGWHENRDKAKLIGAVPAGGVSEHAGSGMPSFFGPRGGSLAMWVPVFVAVTWVFFR